MTALDNAVKLGNVTMKNLLESKALFRGLLRMLSPARLFGGQKWGLRHCVILPRRAYPNEPVSCPQNSPVHTEDHPSRCSQTFRGPTKPGHLQCAMADRHSCRASKPVQMCEPVPLARRGLAVKSIDTSAS